MSEELRYSRHLGLFGAEGQGRIAATAVAIVGLGGLGSHVAQQLAYLGVKSYALVDGDEVSLSNLNRLIGAGGDDVDTAKVEVAARMIGTIQPGATVVSELAHFDPTRHGELLDGADLLFGCVDDDPARLELVRATSTRALPYIDLASDVTADGEFGGRVVFSAEGERCLSCLGELDQHALARTQMSPEQRAADDSIYGVDRAALGGTGPSVVSVNGVVASLAVTEFLAWVTGLRPPRGYLNFRGDLGTVGSRKDPKRTFCHYCMELWPNASRPAPAE